MDLQGQTARMLHKIDLQGTSIHGDFEQILYSTRWCQQWQDLWIGRRDWPTQTLVESRRLQLCAHGRQQGLLLSAGRLERKGNMCKVIRVPDKRIDWISINQVWYSRTICVPVGRHRWGASFLRRFTNVRQQSEGEYDTAKHQSAW